MVYSYMTCRFIQPNKEFSATNYLYRLDLSNVVSLGKRYNIVDENGYTYSGATVEITGTAVRQSELDSLNGKTIKKVKATMTPVDSALTFNYNKELDRMLRTNLGDLLEKRNPNLDKTLYFDCNDFTLPCVELSYKTYGDAAKAFEILKKYIKTKEDSTPYQPFPPPKPVYPTPDNPIPIDSQVDYMTIKTPNGKPVKIVMENLPVYRGDPLVELKSDFKKEGLQALNLSGKNLYNPSDVKAVTPKNIINEGANKMNLFGNHKFGKYEGRDLKISFKGVAIRTAEGKYSSYDIAANEITDVTDFLVDMDMMYLMPAPIKDVARGDVIKHNNNFVVVKIVKSDGAIEAVNVATNEIINILPLKNIFGFNFFTKVLNLFSMGGTTASEDNPFGNALPMMMMAGGGKMDMMSMMAMAYANGGNGMGEMFKNPMMAMAFMNKGDGDMDPMSMMAMMSMFNGGGFGNFGATPAATASPKVTGRHVDSGAEDKGF